MLILTDSLLASNQVLTFSNSWLASGIKKSKSACERKRFVSSANKIKIKMLDASARSFIYIKNKSGPKIDPWRTPQFARRRVLIKNSLKLSDH